jgi:hypothetical protein
MTDTQVMTLIVLVIVAVGLLLAGKLVRAGWAIAFFAELAWLVYMYASHQWKFLVVLPAIVFAAVFAWNWLGWQHVRSRPISSGR